MVPTGRESEYAVTLRQLVIKVQRRIHNADASLEVIRQHCFVFLQESVFPRTQQRFQLDSNLEIKMYVENQTTFCEIHCVSQVKSMLARRRSRGAARIRIINRFNCFQKNASFNEVSLIAHLQMQSPELKVYQFCSHQLLLRTRNRIDH